MQSELKDQKPAIVLDANGEVKNVLAKLGFNYDQESPLGEFLTEEEFQILFQNVDKLPNRTLEDMLEMLTPTSGFNYLIKE